MRSNSPERTHAISSCVRLTGSGWVTPSSSESRVSARGRRRLLAVVEALAHEHVEVELGDHRAAGERHQRAADDERVARDERGGAVGAQLGGPPPLQQRGAHGQQRQRQARAAAEQDEDHERRSVEHVVGEDVGRLVGEDGAALRRVEQPHELGLDDDDRPLRADRHRVRARVLGEVQVRHRVHVERRVGDRVLAPDVAELLLGEPHGRAEIALAQRALVAELDDLADDLVEIGDRGQRGGRGAVGRVLEGARRDPLEAVALGTWRAWRGSDAARIGDAVSGVVVVRDAAGGYVGQSASTRRTYAVISAREPKPSFSIARAR